MGTTKKSLQLYRTFQTGAVVLGAVALAAGQLMEIPALFGAGVALLFHGAIATGLLFMENRAVRSSADSQADTP